MHRQRLSAAQTISNSISGPIRRRSIVSMPRDHVAEREQPRARGLAAAEGQQLPRQPGAAIDRLLDLRRLVARRIVGRQLHQQQVGRAHDAHQDVVEVVRDAAGEAADRFELLRLPQLFLERAPLGDVAEEPGDHGAAVGADPRDRQFDRELGAVGPQAASARADGRRAGRSPGRHVLVERAHVLLPDRPPAAAARRCARGCRCRA